ncbi:MAG: hypothetical protein AAF337_00795 [Pseudomonadota bacterium]
MCIFLLIPACGESAPEDEPEPANDALLTQIAQEIGAQGTAAEEAKGSREAKDFKPGRGPERTAQTAAPKSKRDMLQERKEALAQVRAPIQKKLVKKPGRLDLFGRIQDGDYVWSQSFAHENQGIFAFGLALRRVLTNYCPQAISPNDEANMEFFLAALNGAEIVDVLQGRKALNFPNILSRALGSPAFNALARSRLEDLMNQEGEGCDGRQVKILATNLARMLAGRRPAYGNGAKRTSLAVEKISPLQQKHSYGNQSAAALTGPGAAQLDRDFTDVRKAGMTILECHYDEVPNDEWYEVQYYWGINYLTKIGYLMPNFAESFQHAAQVRLRKANGPRPYVHPFITYGSPRLECPAFKDAAVDRKRIYAPRRAVAPGADSVPIPTEPKVTKKGPFVTYDYGRAPEDYVPPIPEELPNQTLYLTMKKQGTGALKTIEIQRFGHWSLTRYYKNGSAKQDLLDEDVSAIAKQKPRVLVCSYLSPKRGIVNVSRHWFKEAPSAANRARLRGRLSDHPILVISGVRETCSATYVKTG